MPPTGQTHRNDVSKKISPWITSFFKSLQQERIASSGETITGVQPFLTIWIGDNIYIKIMTSALYEDVGVDCEMSASLPIFDSMCRLEEVGDTDSKSYFFLNCEMIDPQNDKY